MEEKTLDRNKVELNKLSPEFNSPNPQIEHQEAFKEKLSQTPDQTRPSQEKEGPSFKVPKLFKTKKTIIPTLRDEMAIKIEKILEDGLSDPYLQLSPIARQEFKLKGEQIATQISQMMKKTHVKIKKIIKLILEWLRMLPGLNRFFLEQEAKIKAEKILRLK